MKKGLLFVLLTIILVSSLMLVGCELFEKDPPAEEPKITEISKPEDLLLLANGGKFKVLNDIICTGLKLKSPHLGENNIEIDGAGHVIRNLTLIGNGSCNYYGLVGSTDGRVTIKKLGMENVTIETNATSDYESMLIGAFVGCANSSVTLEECFASGSISVGISHASNKVGGLVGWCSSANIDNCLSNLEINLGYNNAKFSNAEVFAGGIIGRGGGNSNMYDLNISNCINLSSISSDTSLNYGLQVTSYIGGIVGYAGYLTATNCLSAPKYMLAEAQRDNDLNIGDITIIKSSKIGGIAGYAYKDNNSSKNYYCIYDNPELPKDERDLLCSVYEKINGSSIGVGISLEKTKMLSKLFVCGEWTFTDTNGEEITSYLSLSQDIWNIGKYSEYGFVAPSIKVFD